MAIAFSRASRRGRGRLLVGRAKTFVGAVVVVPTVGLVFFITFFFITLGRDGFAFQDPEKGNEILCQPLYFNDLTPLSSGMAV